ncbi:MAG: hypothetical protein AABW82_04705 [Nanoarchaeota archaeon]
MIIENYLKEGIINKIVETELERYTNFFSEAYKENLEHCKYNFIKFPRWSIISGYYAMHDITKLFLAKKFNIKVDAKVHKSVIKIMEEITKDKDILELLKIGFKEFEEMAADLFEAREERQKAQYYTGTKFMKEKYKERSSSFLKNTVEPYIEKVNKYIQNDI